MNPHKPSREDLELRITMLLLGELSAAEAKTLRQKIAQDAGLEKLHNELRSTIGLVREAEKSPTDTSSDNAASLKLSEERREKLLAHFKTPRPQESFWIRQMKIPSLIPVLVVIAIVALLAAMMLPALSKAKSKSSRVAALSEARKKAMETQVDHSKLQYRTWSGDNTEHYPVSAPAAPVDSAPAVVTVAPEPVLAPPPAAIFLPSAYQTTLTAGLNSSGGDRGVMTLGDNSHGDGIDFYKGVAGTGVGGTARIAAGNVVSTVPADLSGVKTDGDAQAGAQPISSGGGGGGGAGGSPPTSGTMLAFDNSAANRSNVKNEVASPAPTAQLELFSSEANKKPAAGDFAFTKRNAETPPTSEISALNMPAKKYGGEEIVKGASQLRSIQPATSARTRAIKVTPLPGARSAVSADENGAAPVAMSDTIAASPATIVLPPAEVPALQNGAPTSGNLDFQAGALPASDRDSGAPARQFYGNLSREGKDLSESAVPPVMAKTMPPTTVGVIEKSGRTELGLNGANADVSGTTFAARMPATVTLDSLPAGAMKEDAEGGRYLLITNSATLADDRTLLGKAPARPDKPLVHASLLALTTTPASAEANQQSYEAEKRKLQDLEATHKMLNLKITANSIDANIPTTSMVQITDAAEPSKKQTFWQSLRGEYASTAKIKVENEGGIISGFNQPAAAAMRYDPYFIQTTFEIMQSSLVLGKVVDDLHLDTAWADKNGGQKLSKVRAIELLKSRMSLQPIRNTKLVAISMTSDKPDEAAKLANAVAMAYQNYRVANNQQTARTGLEALRQQYTYEEQLIEETRAKLASLEPKSAVTPVEPVAETEVPVRRAPANAPVPQPEILTSENAFSTFSLNVSDVSFKLAEASLEKGQMPEAANIRSEEFINAFDYRDPEAVAGQPMAFASERARYPFAHNRELLRFSIKTAAMGRPAGRALNLVLLLDNSGSMERADRVAIIREALHVLAGQLQPQDTVSVVTFARTARLWADGVAGDKAGETLGQVGDITPEGGTNLEEAMRLAYETAHRHYLANGLNRVVLLTDGAANLGNIDPAVLKQNVEAQRKQGIALDCFGIGFEGYDDDLLEQLSRNGDGRYAFINSLEDAGKEFAAKLAGALQIAAADVKVQVEFNPQRVTSYRQIGYAKHQLTKEQFRDNTVDAAEIAAQEAGNALYTIETKTDGTGPVATVHVRYKVPGTTDYKERGWDVAYDANVPALEQSSAAMRLAGTASAFSEWLAVSPFAQEVTPDELLKLMSGVPEIYGADERPKKLEWMIRQAKSLSGK